MGAYLASARCWPVSGQADFYRKIWSHGPEGISVPLNLLPKDLSEMKIRQVPVQSIDRSDRLRLRRSY